MTNVFTISSSTWEDNILSSLLAYFTGVFISPVNTSAKSWLSAFSYKLFQSTSLPWCASTVAKYCAILVTLKECAATLCSKYLNLPGNLINFSKSDNLLKYWWIAILVILSIILSLMILSFIIPSNYVKESNSIIKNK